MRKVFILGASGDIGAAIMHRFVSDGYKVVCPGHKELDLADSTSIDRYFITNRPEEIDPDVVINAAGINFPESCEKIDEERLKSIYSINTVSFFLVLKKLLPVLKQKKSSRILGISSLYGTFARECRMPYVMSKHAMNGMIKTLALELAPFGILANTVSPGFVDTKLTRQNNDPATVKKLESKIPVGRLARPSEIAEVALFLCSEKNSYINGQDIVVDGGFSVGGFQN